MKTRSVRPMGLLFGGALLVAACTIVDGLTLLVPPGPSDGGEDAAPCVHARWPEKTRDASGGGDLEFTVAIRMSLADTSGPVAGYDLDGVCSCTGDPPGPQSCKTTAPIPPCDDPQGRDTSMRTLLRSLESVYNIAEDVKYEFELGRVGVLLRVAGYNGLADDDDVSVALFSSRGIQGPDGDGGVLYFPPKLDASDRWTINSDDIVESTARLVPKFPRLGYVADGVLVVPAPFTFRLSTAFQVEVVHGILTGPIERDGAGNPTLRRGTLAGRWPTATALRMFGLLREASDKRPYCERESFATLAKSVICPAADLAVDPAASSDAPCNAISIGFDFEAYPASVGDVVTTPALGDDCADAARLSCD